MSPQGSVYYGGFSLTDDRTGSVIEEPGSLCVAVDALAARYTQEELSQIGSSSSEKGEVLVIKSVVGNPEGFQFGCTKPHARVSAGQLVIAGEVL